MIPQKFIESYLQIDKEVIILVVNCDYWQGCLSFEMSFMKVIYRAIESCLYISWNLSMWLPASVELLEQVSHPFLKIMGSVWSRGVE